MISNMNNQKIELEEFNIDEDVKQVLLGSLLGDGSLQIPKEGKNAFYREIHSQKQKEYIIWKNNFLKFFDTRFHEYSFYDKRTNKTYYSVLLWSKTHPTLTHYCHVFYSKGRKAITKEILNQINILGLAVWYMDDGYYHYGNYRCALSTNAYSYEEQIIIKNWFKNNFNINSQIHKRKKGTLSSYNIVLSRESTNNFLRLIYHYIIPCMCYKLGHLKEENFSKIEVHDNKGVEYRKLAYQLNKEKHCKRNKEYYKANKEILIKQKKKFYSLNKEKILKEKKDYYIKNRAIIREKQRQYYLNNIEKFKEYNKERINQTRR